MSDYLNRKRLRNQENTPEDSYNCGGYALGTYNWYLPYGHGEDREKTVNELLMDGYTEEEVYTALLNKDLEMMLFDFQDKIRVIHHEGEAADDEKIIAYRIFVEFGFHWSRPCYDNSDFHYRIKQDGVWFEKNGDGPIHRVEKMEFIKPWLSDCGEYDSDVILLALKS